MQEQRLQKLKDRIGIPFDETRPDHQVSISPSMKPLQSTNMSNVKYKKFKISKESKTKLSKRNLKLIREETVNY